MFRLLSYNQFDKYVKPKPNQNGGISQNFEINMYGRNERGQSCFIRVTNFKPFFYVKVDKSWDKSMLKILKNEMDTKLTAKLGKDYYEGGIHSMCYESKKKLYMFDNETYHKFVKISFHNDISMKKYGKLWYDERPYPQNDILRDKGFIVEECNTYLYEFDLPSLLRFFHVTKIKPSGWVKIDDVYKINYKNVKYKHSRCDYEYEVPYDKIMPINDKETSVPFRILSYDLEVGSSHGDFPLSKKDYKKLATNIIDYCRKDEYECDSYTLKKLIMSSFGFATQIDGIELIYTKPINKDDLELLIDVLVNSYIGNKKINKSDDNSNNIITFNNVDDDDELFSNNQNKKNKKYGKKAKLLDMINDDKCDRETKIIELTKLFSSVEHKGKTNIICFPKVHGDGITFIGSSLMYSNESKPYKNNCIVLNSCSDVEGVEIESCDTEKNVILKWGEFIRKEDPDIIIGYNIFGFDNSYIFDRANELNILEKFLELSKINKEICCPPKYPSKTRHINKHVTTHKKTTIDLTYIHMNGRIEIDLMRYFMKNYQLPSYKLDFVSNYYIGDYVTKHEVIDGNTIIYTKNMSGLEKNSFVCFDKVRYTFTPYKNNQKFKIINIDNANKTFTINSEEHFDPEHKIRWGLAKDDVTPKDIFRLSNEGPDERAIVAKYCIKDCTLVHNLLLKMDIVTEFTEMSNLCCVPINFLVFRGQGIKLASYMYKKCLENDTLINTIKKDEHGENDDTDAYEGAIVLDPKEGYYEDDPVGCNDFSSLYPSSADSENLSHDSLTWVKMYDLDNKLIKIIGEQDENGNFIYDNLPDCTYVTTEFDTYKKIKEHRVDKNGNKSFVEKKVKVGHNICRFAKKDGKKAILPKIITELLAARKQTKQLMKNETNTFMKKVLDKRQNSIKLTNNSLYGQCGSSVSLIYEQNVAASITATGRKLLLFSKQIIEGVYGNTILESKKYGKVRSKAKYVYGDTDSVFYRFNFEEIDGTKIKGKQALEMTIEFGHKIDQTTSKFLKPPHTFEYEKTFMPFFIPSKKRYMGLLYENDPDNYEIKSMGLILKRLDNAPIAKDIYGGILDILMFDEGNNKANHAIQFLRNQLQKIIDKQVPIEKLIISKSLRSDYANPDSIAHNVLAERIGKRDPGNKPKPGDRVSYIFIQTKNNEKLQGNKIETPEFIKENNLKIDYGYYIENQIMKPVQQIFALLLDNITEYNKKKYEHEFKYLEQNLSNEKYIEERDKLRNQIVKKLIFDKYINLIKCEKMGMKPLDTYFTKK